VRRNRKALSHGHPNFPFYMDNHSDHPGGMRGCSTPCCPYFREDFGNAARPVALSLAGTPSGPWRQAREQVAAVIGASGREIVLDLGAPLNPDNLAIKGAADFYRDRGNHIITALATGAQRPCSTPASGWRSRASR